MNSPIMLQFDHDSKGAYVVLKFIYDYEDNNEMYPMTAEILWMDEEGVQLAQQFTQHIDVSEFERAIVDGVDIF